MLLAWVLVLLVTAWLLASRLLPWIIARVVSLFLSQAKFRLGGIGKRLELFQSQLQFRNLELSVDNLRLTSSIFSSEASNLITIIATGVRVSVMPRPPDSAEESGGAGTEEKPRSTKTLLLVAQFLGVQLREVSVRVAAGPALPDCQLELQLGELRLDSSVIHRTKLSLALYLYQGSLLVTHANHGSLLESSFAFQASIQALVAGGKISCVEDVNLDIDGLSLNLYSSLFQCVLPVGRRAEPKAASAASPPSYLKYSSFIPKAAQIKAECCSVVLEHSQRGSQLASSLALLYVCVKCADPQRAGAGPQLPDSHLTAQVTIVACLILRSAK